MKTLIAVLLTGLMLSGGGDAPIESVASAESGGPTVETIVCVRHGEKPPGGLGQLTCRGLNRALALPEVLFAKFGPPKFVFAPNPTQKVDGNGTYCYVRPLVTIAPTAIRCGLPINTEFGFREIKGLESELQKPQYKGATVFVAWEHALLDEFVKDLLKANGANPAQVPAWPGSDYDSIFVVKITHTPGGQFARFTIRSRRIGQFAVMWAPK